MPVAALETSVVDTMDHAAVARFDMLRKMFERSYPDLGRVPEQAPIDGVTLDFEIETMAQVKLTPELVLLRGGIDLRAPPPAGMAFIKDSDRPAFLRSGALMPEDVSDWFTVGLDGQGRYPKNKTVFRQDLRAQVEIESVLMRPQTVLDSSFTDDLNDYLLKMGTDQKNALLPGASEVFFDGGIGADDSCTKCHLQWTVGLGLTWVPKLLWKSNDAGLRKVLHRINKICWNRENGCTPNYQAFLSLASWVLSATHECRSCAYTKRCMEPWLVRTHLGDLATYVKEREDPDSWSRMPAEVIRAAGIENPTGPVLLDGVVDYLHFAEMAELSGSVRHRDAANAEYDEQSWATHLPIDATGLLRLASRMLYHKKEVNIRISHRDCKIHGKNDPVANEFSALDWVRGLDNGMDIMSDHDSPISKNSFSHLVWKSMGSWRMRKSGSAVVYLECRSSNHCLPGKTKHFGVPNLIRYVGRSMVEFEQEAASETAKSLQDNLQLQMLEEAKEREPKPFMQTFYNGFMRRLQDTIMPADRLMRKEAE